MTSNSLVWKLECDQDTCYLAYGTVPGYPPYKKPEEILGAWLEAQVGSITSFLIGLVAGDAAWVLLGSPSWPCVPTLVSEPTVSTHPDLATLGLGVSPRSTTHPHLWPTWL